jgi:hypothetical protein
VTLKTLPSIGRSETFAEVVECSDPIVGRPFGMTNLLARNDAIVTSFIRRRHRRTLSLRDTGAPPLQLFVLGRYCLINRDDIQETTMRKTVLASLLIVGSTIQIAAAAERYAHNPDRARATASQQFRNANDSLASPSAHQQDWSDYSEGHVISAVSVVNSIVLVVD